MSFNRVIKKNALAILSGRWRRAVILFLFILLVILVINIIDMLFLQGFAPAPDFYQGVQDYGYFLRRIIALSPAEAIITTISVIIYFGLLSPILLGVQGWFYILVQGGSPSFYDVFRFFESRSRYLRAIAYALQLSVRSTLLGIAFLGFPAIVLGISWRFLLSDAISRSAQITASLGLVLAACILLLGSILYLIHLNRYCLVAYLLCESDSVGVSKSFAISVRYTKGYRGIKFLLELSFIGWYLLAVITFLLGLFFLLPYKAAAGMVFARYLVEKNRGSRPDEFTREFNPAPIKGE